MFLDEAHPLPKVLWKFGGAGAYRKSMKGTDVSKFCFFGPALILGVQHPLQFEPIQFLALT